MCVIVSCSGKFHAFALAEQFHKHNMLRELCTTYAYQKNVYFRCLAKRIDKEAIPESLIHTNIPLAFLIKGFPKDYIWNEWYDHWVAQQLQKRKDYKIFIGWSGMSLHAIKQAKKDNKITILERGSSHIQYQNTILKEEYKKFGVDFSIDKQVIEKELKEYEEADFISIPSIFVKNSFIEMGIPAYKLVLNNYGASSYFKKDPSVQKGNKFIILYLGSVSIRKGLIYFFQALQSLNIKEEDYEVWFIGNVNAEMKQTIVQYNKPNWHWKGHIPHYELVQWISQCTIAVQPSLEEGLSTVIPQIMTCGLPVIASVNSGGEDVIDDGVNGFIIPIRSPQHIKEKIEYLYNNPPILAAMKAATQVHKDLSWDNYGNRYVLNLKNILDITS